MKDFIYIALLILAPSEKQTDELGSTNLTCKSLHHERLPKSDRGKED